MPIDLQKLFRKDSLNGYYDLDGLKDVCLTADIDWAPDYASELALDIAASYGCQITAFATHRSSLLRAPPSHVEVGQHPDNTRP